MNRVLISAGLVLLVGCSAVFCRQQDSQAKKDTPDRQAGTGGTSSNDCGGCG